MLSVLEGDYVPNIADYLKQQILSGDVENRPLSISAGDVYLQ